MSTTLYLCMCHTIHVLSIDLITQSVIQLVSLKTIAFTAAVFCVQFSTIASAGFSTMAQQIGSHQGGGFLPLYAQGPIPSKAHMPQPMSPMIHSSQKPCGRQSDAATPQAHEFGMVAERRFGLREHAREQGAGENDVQVVKAVESVPRRYLQSQLRCRRSWFELVVSRLMVVQVRRRPGQTNSGMHENPRHYSREVGTAKLCGTCRP